MVDLADAAVVAILTRAPSSGGKTRLFGALGRPPDPALLEALLLDTLDAAAVAGAVRVVAVEPPSARAEMRELVPGIEVIAQVEGSLGVRMAAVMEDLLRRGARLVVLVGSDLPDLPPSVITAAIEAVDADPSQLVLGPAADGGYYLIAASAVPPVFEGVPWGSGHVLARTRAAAERHGIRVHLLESAEDVDTPAVLQRVRARRTRAWTRLHTGPPARP